jgi:hypothetical protein
VPHVRRCKSHLHTPLANLRRFISQHTYAHTHLFTRTSFFCLPAHTHTHTHTRTHTHAHTLPSFFLHTHTHTHTHDDECYPSDLSLNLVFCLPKELDAYDSSSSSFHNLVFSVDILDAYDSSRNKCSFPRSLSFPVFHAIIRSTLTFVVLSLSNTHTHTRTQHTHHPLASF